MKNLYNTGAPSACHFPGYQDNIDKYLTAQPNISACCRTCESWETEPLHITAIKWRPPCKFEENSRLKRLSGHLNVDFVKHHHMHGPGMRIWSQKGLYISWAALLGDMLDLTKLQSVGLQNTQTMMQWKHKFSHQTNVFGKYMDRLEHQVCSSFGSRTNPHKDAEKHKTCIIKFVVGVLVKPWGFWDLCSCHLVICKHP